MSKRNKQLILRLAAILLLIILALIVNRNQSFREDNSQVVNVRKDVVEVHFIDVGQGDAILVEADDAAMLIDAGENNKGSLVVDYLKNHHITKLDYIIGTHPHSDHIGGMDTVLKAFPVDKVILPSVSHTTKTFEDVLDAIEEKNLKITKPLVGTSYSLGSASFTILSPTSEPYQDMNNYSIVIKLTYGKNSFLFTGDAEKLVEKELLKSGLDLSADVLKLGHHGSASSSSQDFLDAVNPSHAVICVGKNNDYGHPHVETMQLMQDLNVKLYRTDLQGTVVFTSDGKTIAVNTSPYKITENDLKND